AVARALFDAGFEAEADRLLAQSQPSAASAVLVELEVARLAVARDELDRARTLLQAPAGSPQPVKRPKQPDAWLLLARVYAREGRLDLSAQLAKRMLELSPLHPEAASAWHLLSRDAVERRESELAQQYLERAEFLRDWHDVMRARRLQIRLTPEDPLPRLGLALGWMKVERWSEAESVLTGLVARFPDYCRAYFQLGEARRLSGDPRGAIEAYEVGQQCDPQDMRLTLNRALLLREIGRVDEALVELQRVVASPAGEDPLFLGAHLELARALRGAERIEEADAAYARYRALGGTEAL
ncbi:MAG: tetratricopeptide repeat protein, partial [Planctomycetota bacterium]